TEFSYEPISEATEKAGRKTSRFKHFGWLTFIARSRFAPLTTHKIQIWVDPNGIQTPTAKRGFGGAYKCRHVTSSFRVSKAVFGPVHPGKDGHDFSPVPAGEPFSLFL